jgi:hypothetical protein
VTVDQPDLLEVGDEDDEGSGKPKVTMADLVNKYLAAQELKVLPEQGMELAVEHFVKGTKTAIKECVAQGLERRSTALRLTVSNACTSFVNATLQTYHKSADRGSTEEDGIEAEVRPLSRLTGPPLCSQWVS